MNSHYFKNLDFLQQIIVPAHPAPLRHNDVTSRTASQSPDVMRHAGMTTRTSQSDDSGSYQWCCCAQLCFSVCRLFVLEYYSSTNGTRSTEIYQQSKRIEQFFLDDSGALVVPNAFLNRASLVCGRHDHPVGASQTPAFARGSKAWRLRFCRRRRCVVDHVGLDECAGAAAGPGVRGPMRGGRSKHQVAGDRCGSAVLGDAPA